MEGDQSEEQGGEWEGLRPWARALKQALKQADLVGQGRVWGGKSREVGVRG